jgi:thiamine kinase-like enzyme
MTQLDSEILAKLTQAIAALVPTVYETGAELANTTPEELHRRYSFIFRYQIRQSNGAQTPILVKIPHESWMHTFREAIGSSHIQDVIRNEYETMTAIADAIEASNHQKLFAIRPKAILLDFNALVMDEISIQMLKKQLIMLPIILGAKEEWHQFEMYLNLSGDWLKVIHEKYSTNTLVSLYDLGIMEKVEGILVRLEQSQNRSLRHLRKLFDDLYESSRKEQIRISSLHNDFHPGNIFMTDEGKVGVLDPNWLDSGPIFLDIASMLVYPATGRSQVLTLGTIFRGSLQRRYEQAFLSRYFGKSKIPYAALFLYCAVAVLEKWYDNEELIRTNNSKLYRFGSWFLIPWIGYYFQRLIKDYLERGLANV